MTEIDYRRLVRRLRPARVATVVPESGSSWHATAMRMIENNSVVWGGSENAIVPIGTDESIAAPWWRLLALYDPDRWSAYALTPRHFLLADEAQYQTWHDTALRELVADRNDPLRDSALRFLELHLDEPAASTFPERFLAAVLQHTSPFHMDGLVDLRFWVADGEVDGRLTAVDGIRPLPPTIHRPMFDNLPAPVGVLLADRFGGLGDRQAERLRSAGVGVTDWSVNPADFMALVQRCWHLDLGLDLGLPGSAGGGPELGGVEQFVDLSATPRSLSTAGLRELRRWYPGIDERPAIIVVGDDLASFCYAHLMKRCGARCCWLPVTGDVALDGRLQDALASELADLRRQRRTDSVVLVTMSGERHLHDVAERLRKERCLKVSVEASETIDELLPPFRLPLLVDPAYTHDELSEPFLDRAMMRSIPLAVPSAAQPAAGGFGAMNWVIDVEDELRLTPARSTIGHGDLVASVNSFRCEARTGRDGLSFGSSTLGIVLAGQPFDQVGARPRLNFPHLTRVVEALATVAGYSTRESPAGRFQRLSMEMWGGFDPLLVDLALPGRVRMLRGWLSSADSGRTPGVKGHATRWLSIDDASRLHVESEGDIREVVDRLLERGVLRRGLVLKCSNCLQFDWYDLEVLGQTFACHRCSTRRPVIGRNLTGASEPPFYYAMAEVVRQAFKNNFEVPVAALGRLRATSPRRSFEFVSEFELLRNGKSEVELDICASVDGRLVIGEAKSTDSLGGSAGTTLAKLEGAALALTADEVVLATSVRWNASTRTRIENWARGKSFEVRILEQLLPPQLSGNEGAGA